MSDWNAALHKPVTHLAEQLRGIRTGTLTPGFVETFRVAWEGGTTPISHIAGIRHEGGRIVITPFDRAIVPAIVKCLVEAKQNAYALDPQRVSVSIPPLSGEQRAEILRHVKQLGEEAKVSVRTIRQELRKQLAAAGKRSDRTIQEYTDDAISKIEVLVSDKIAELER